MKEEEVLRARTAKGGWTKAQLTQWGIPWPPPKGWKKKLVQTEVGRQSAETSVYQPYEETNHQANQGKAHQVPGSGKDDQTNYGK